MTTSETSAQGAEAPPTGVEPTPPPSSLDLVGVTAQRRAGWGWVTVLADLDLAVAPGELVALMGPSGSGKSSVIQMACGLLAPTAGTVRIEGEEMAGGDRAGWAAARRRHLGVVHQRLDLLDGLSVIDNVALPLLLDGGRSSPPTRRRWRLWPVSAPTTSRGGRSRTCPAANSSGWPSPVRWSGSGVWSWPTSPPPPSTPSPPRRSSSSSPRWPPAAPPC